MATRLTPKKSEGQKPATKKVSPDQAAPEETVSNGPAQGTAPPEETAPCTRSHIPNARTRKALRDADAGKNLTEYADADDLFRKLGIPLGQEEA